MSVQNVIVPAFGWFDGLPHHLQSIREYSPTSVIHVLDDGTCPERIAELKVDHSASILDYGKSFEAFSKVYRWCGSNSLEFELACYRRHYAIHDYCVALGIKNCWYFDWDVLVFCDLESEAARLSKWKGMRWQGNNFINDMAFFGEYLESWIRHPLATNPDQPNSDQHLELEIRRNGGYGSHYLDSLLLQEDGSCYDGNLCIREHGFAMNKGATLESGMKWLMWVRGASSKKSFPFGYFEPISRWVRLKTLHCWGDHKARMATYLRLATANYQGCENQFLFVS